MKLHYFLLISLALTGCTSQPTVSSDATHLLRDDLFAAGTRPVTSNVFELTPAMQRYLDVDIQPQLFAEGRATGLINALYSKRQLRLEYNSELTRNAAATYAERAGNCLSLVIMTAAMAKHIGLPVTYQQVVTDNASSLYGDFLFSAGHVNITLGKTPIRYATRLAEDQSLTVDFLPQQSMGGMRSVPISEARVLAMYMNNRAAETLSEANLGESYWWAREAILADPAYVASYNTLGIIYRHRGELATADAALRYALQMQPGNPRTMSNLVLVLEDLGKHAQAQALALELRRIEPNPPFHFYRQAQLALKQRHYAAARDLFQLELNRNQQNHEIHFGLAAAYLGLGDLQAAKKQLKIAHAQSARLSDQSRYSAKLQQLKSTSYQ